MSPGYVPYLHRVKRRRNACYDIFYRSFSAGKNALNKPPEKPSGESRKTNKKTRSVRHQGENKKSHSVSVVKADQPAHHDCHKQQQQQQYQIISTVCCEDKRNSLLRTTSITVSRCTAPTISHPEAAHTQPTAHSEAHFQTELPVVRRPSLIGVLHHYLLQKQNKGEKREKRMD